MLASFLKGGVEFDAELVVERVELEVIGFGGAVGELVEDFEMLVICVFCRHICLL